MVKILICSKKFQDVTTYHDYTVREVHMCDTMCDTQCHAFRKQFDRRHDIAQTMRNLAVLTNFVSLKGHDVARHIAEHCGNKICAIVKLA